jgi:hypothetical protein
MVLNNLERAAADGAGGTKDNDLFLAHSGRS